MIITADCLSGIGLSPHVIDIFARILPDGVDISDCDIPEIAGIIAAYETDVAGIDAGSVATREGAAAAAKDAYLRTVSAAYAVYESHRVPARQAYDADVAAARVVYAAAVAAAGIEPDDVQARRAEAARKVAHDIAATLRALVTL